jgi:hypothetical protein
MQDCSLHLDPPYESETPEPNQTKYANQPNNKDRREYGVNRIWKSHMGRC